MSSQLTSLLLIGCFLLAQCAAEKNADIQKETEAISTLLKQEQKAHLEENADLFVSEFAPGMISINRGNLSTHTTEQHKKRIKSYFDQVEFVKWEDVVEPQIKFSDDASLAYAILQKQVPCLILLIMHGFQF